MPEVRIDKDSSGEGFVRLDIDGLSVYIEVNTDKYGKNYVNYIEVDNEEWMTADGWEEYYR